MVDYHFRPLTDEEEPLAYSLLAAGLELERSRRTLDFQYPYPPESYARRQAARENFGLFRDGQLVSCVSLGPLASMEWRWGFARRFPNVRGLAQVENRLRRPRFRRPYLWLSTLVAGDVPERAGLGRLTLEGAALWAEAQSVRRLYLQASSRDGLLTRYYRASGFRELRRKPAKGPFEWVLFEGDVEAVLTRHLPRKVSLEINDQSEKSRHSPRTSL